jgi:chemotaxis protein MotB
MTGEDDAPEAKCPEEAPAWAMTFADLISLLMCFFVLLLSFSSIDVMKYEQISGEMSTAFGVQHEIKAKDIPKGTSVVNKHFRPGKPEPTSLNIVRQHTTDDLRKMLKTVDAKNGKQNTTRDNTKGGAKSDVPTPEQIKNQLALAVAQDARLIREAFKEQVDQGLIDVETDEQRVIIRIQEKGSFPSGNASLKPGFEPVIQDIAKVLVTTDGNIVITGHTDNIPISTARFRSNWELSAARAITVVHYLKKVPGLTQDRFLIEGHADSNPLVDNDSAQRRTKNRRVEIIIVKSNGVVKQVGAISSDNVTAEDQADDSADDGPDDGADDGADDGQNAALQTEPPRKNIG